MYGWDTSNSGTRRHAGDSGHHSEVVQRADRAYGSGEHSGEYAYRAARHRRGWWQLADSTSRVVDHTGFSIYPGCSIFRRGGNTIGANYAVALDRAG